MIRDKVRILISGDNGLRESLNATFPITACHVEVTDNPQHLLAIGSEGNTPDLIILDAYPAFAAAVNTTRQLRAALPETPVLVLSSGSPPREIVEIMKSGATDVLLKPVAPESLRSIACQLVPRIAALELAPEQYDDVDVALDATQWHRKLAPVITKVAVSDVPILILGETGVGKEVLARKIHDRSRRASKMFLKLNCAAMPPELVESELFGYERGAFTGAFRNNPGKFEIANGGTFLLDEIGDMELKLQAKLLQVLQDREFLRLGSKETTRVDVRVIAATHRNLEEAIVSERFREDLYYRLNVVTITIPPLRDRRDEIMPLAAHFFKKYAEHGAEPARFTRRLYQAFLAHDWPGNIRELENVVRRYIVTEDEHSILEQMHTSRRHDLLRQEVRATPQAHPSPVNAVAQAISGSLQTPAWSEAFVEGPAQPLFAAESASEVLSEQLRAAESVVQPPASPLLSPRMAERSPTGASGPAETAVQAVSAASSATGLHPALADTAVTSGSTALKQVEDASRRAETEVILRALESTLWNRKRAAALLGTDYKALLYKMKKLGIGEVSVETSQ